MTKISKFYGAKYDLEKLIKTHLFVISPDKSGTTFLKEALATSQNTWNLVNEGQFTYGFNGWSGGELKAGLLWSTKPEWIAKLSDSSAYNWPLTRKAWYFQAFSSNPNASVFVEKSPPSLLRVGAMIQHFHNAKFLFMVRNPYAVVEGIYRRRKHQLGKVALDRAAQHIMTCFQYQRENIERYSDYGIFFRYEDMCAEPEKVQQQIQLLVPELSDLKLRQKIDIKGMYNEMLRNMNAQQLSRLEPEDFKQINRTFNKHKALLAYFDYPILEEATDDC